MKRHFQIILSAALCLFLLIPTLCKAQGPKVSVRVALVSVSSDTVILSPGESSPIALNVPLSVTFQSEIVADDGHEYVLFPQWTVTRTITEDGEEHTGQFLKRQESVTDYDFTEYGHFRVSFEWSYRDRDSLETIPGEAVEPIDFTIDDSVLRLYNAFSPNGDGINDVYRIYVRSMVDVNIRIFNRWGQTVKTLSGSMDKLISEGAEPDADGGFMIDVWDGMQNGNAVNDGVYFINVQATGAGGRKYNEKADINVLTGLGNQSLQ